MISSSEASWIALLKSLEAKSLHFGNSFIRRYSVILLPSLFFLLLTLGANWRLFAFPLIPNGDSAVNAIQVQSAKHLHDLLGNYSRWHIHHPGPFFFYLFASGETIFYNLLHVVPAPFNGEYLAQLIFNTICLFLTIYIFFRHVSRPLFPPLAVTVSIFFLYVLYATIPYAASVPIWPPYMAVFCFLLLLASCASVASGKWSHTPLLTFSSLVMLHSHAAQLLFASVLPATALLCAIIREKRYGNLSEVFNRHRRSLLTALFIALLLLSPILIDWLSNHPSNVDQIRVYLKQHHGEHNSAIQSFLYLASFFTFDANPEIAFAKPAPTLINILNNSTDVKVYWTLFFMITILAVWGRVRLGGNVPIFIKFALTESGFVILLFLYWSWRITGPMYNFNGFFFFSLQLFVLFSLCALFTYSIRGTLTREMQIALTCVSMFPLPLAVSAKNGYPSDQEIPVIFNKLTERHIQNVEITMPMDQQIWPTGAGLARYMQRFGMKFCFGPEWQFMFGASYICDPIPSQYHVSLSLHAPVCDRPCTALYSRPGLFVSGAPIPSFLTLPALVSAGDCTHETVGFDALEGNSTWSQKKGLIKFYLASEAVHDRPLVLEITGTMLPGRPAEIILNHHSLGWIRAPGRSTQEFNIDTPQIAWGGANILELLVPHAAPLGTDTRIIGYFFERFVIRAR